MCDVIEPSAYVERVRRARKQHRCCECGDIIHIAELYVYASGVWDGYARSYKTCRRCATARDKAIGTTRFVDACGPAFGALADWFAEVFDLSGNRGDVIAAGGDLLGGAK